MRKSVLFPLCVWWNGLNAAERLENAIIEERACGNVCMYVNPTAPTSDYHGQRTYDQLELQKGSISFRQNRELPEKKTWM